MKIASGREASMARRRALVKGKAGLPEAAMPTDSPAPTHKEAEPITVNSVAVSAGPVSAGFGSGREASMARRRMLVKGKGGLPAAHERVRSGFREAAMPRDVPSAVAPVIEAAPVVVSAPEAPAAAVVAAAAPVSTGFGSGREASMARRKMLVKGKGGLPAAHERVRSGFREAAMPKDAPSVVAPVTEAPVTEAPVAEAQETTVLSCQTRAPLSACTGREAAMRHRQARSRYGRGEAPASSPCRPPRQGELSYPSKVPAVTTAVSNATVTGLSYAAGRTMTGAEAGYDKPLTGTQYVGGVEGGYRASLGKVGHASTDGGQTVSGTMVRSTIKITGDEESSDVWITGDADQRPSDDLNAKGEAFIPVGAQFQRQSQPHGQSVHGANLGRSARAVGSRHRDTERPVEQTDGGHAVSGTAIGRSIRVTGDEPGAQRHLTGSQYLAPAAAQALIEREDGRADPASGGKVTASQTWGGQTVTGPEMEHDRRVTGSEHGACSPMTGTPYYGATGAHGWCDAEIADDEGALRGDRTPRAITGDVPLHDPMVSGTDRGANRTITGSAYFVADEVAGHAEEADMVVESINGFSVSSPQRTSHLEARDAAPKSVKEDNPSGITGTFAQGEGKITGNVEFAACGRSPRAGFGAAHRAVTGEGAVKGLTVSGSAWDDDDRVTGTEDYIANGRNPSRRGRGQSQDFAGAGRFKSKASSHDQTSSVTGAVGWTPKTGAAVTLSGGAAA